VITVDTAPVLQSVDVTPSVAWTNTTLACRFNITGGTGSLSANITWWRWNQSGSLNNFSLLDHTVTVTSGEYNYSFLNVTWNYTHHNESWFCSVRPCDDSGCYSWSNSTNRSIQEYSTSLVIDSETSSPLQDQMVYIFANFTASGKNVSGIGLVNYHR